MSIHCISRWKIIYSRWKFLVDASSSFVPIFPKTTNKGGLPINSRIVCWNFYLNTSPINHKSFMIVFQWAKHYAHRRRWAAKNLNETVCNLLSQPAFQPSDFFHRKKENLFYYQFLLTLGVVCAFFKGKDGSVMWHEETGKMNFREIIWKIIFQIGQREINEVNVCKDFF